MGVMALSTLMPHLFKLDLGSNALSDTGAAALEAGIGQFSVRA
jgi:hypothetical protein